jgi:hypothetical protein
MRPAQRFSDLLHKLESVGLCPSFPVLDVPAQFATEVTITREFHYTKVSIHTFVQLLQFCSSGLISTFATRKTPRKQLEPCQAGPKS